MLLVYADDDEDDVEVFREVVNSIDRNIVCQVFKDGQDLLNFLEDCLVMPDLIFLDINMPFVNGMQCLERLKSNTNFRTIPVIIYTTSSRSVDRDKAIDEGATEYVVKSHDFSESYKNIYKAIKKFL
jgi:CheY-like chemotaxis protein